jgi:beta-alanine--pyruvate transaminase
VNFGGISVGGIGPNRKLFGEGVSADHLRHTLLPENVFTRGMPEKGAELAEELEELVALHDASNIAAVIVEPFAGSAGVLPPPKGYLQRLRAICDKHQILLIFDEVITGFGRAGALSGADAFGVTPDIMNFAKQLTNGAVPMGAVVVKEEIYRTFMSTGGPDYMLEFPHGYTYSGHPIACAAGIAALDLLLQDKLIDRVKTLAPYFEDGIHSLKGRKHVVRHPQLRPRRRADARAASRRTRATTVRGRDALLGARTLCPLRRRHAAVRSAVRHREERSRSHVQHRRDSLDAQG